MLLLHNLQRSLGAVYTPAFLADYLAEVVVSLEPQETPLQVLDPACGDGALLDSFRRIHLKQHRQSKIEFVGIDKDRTAIVRARNSLKFQNIRLVEADALLDPWPTRTAKRRRVIISNPPWGASLDSYDRNDLRQSFTVANGQFDSFGLFVEAILNHCSQGDLFGLILPDSIFAQEHIQIRSLLLNSTSLTLVARLGEKLFPGVNRGCAIFVGRKAPVPAKHSVTCFRLNAHHRSRILSAAGTLKDAQEDLSHLVPQSRFLENENLIIDLDLKVADRTFQKMSRVGALVADYVTTHRGVELSKNGNVCRCPVCGLWMPYPAADTPKCVHCRSAIDLVLATKDRIVRNHNGKGNLPFKTGEDLCRYTSYSRTWIDTNKKGINYKSPDLYSGPKILVRKTGVGITASMDYSDALTNQVVYVLKLRPLISKFVTLEFVLAVLNSRAMTYYLLKKHGENEWRSHPYVTQTILESLPFPAIDDTSPGHVGHIIRITDTVKRAFSIAVSETIDIELDGVIESSVAALFKLNVHDYREIYRTLKSAQPLVPIRRLLNIGSGQIFNQKT